MSDLNSPKTAEESPVRTLVTDVRTLGLPRLAALPLGYVALSYTARTLRPADFGSLQFALGLVNYFGIIAALGLPILGTRELARDPQSAGEWLPAVVLIRLALGCGAYALLVVLAAVGPFPSATRSALLIFGLVLLATAFNLDWYFQGLGAMRALSVATAVGSGVGALCLLLLVRRPGDAGPAAWALGAGAVSSYLVLIVWLYWRPPPRLRRPSWVVHRLLRPALPLGLATVITTAFYNLDAVMLGFLRPRQDVAFYGAAYRLIFALIWLSTALSTSLLPLLSRLHRDDRRSFSDLVERLGRSFIVLGVPAGILSAFYAHRIIVVVFGDRYAAGGTTLAVLSCSFFIFLVGVGCGWGLVAADDERGWLMGVAGGFVLNLVLDALLIPVVGIVGAATATLAAEAAIATWMVTRFRRVGDASLIGTIVRCCLAGAVMAGTLAALRSWAFPVAVLGGVAAYVVAGIAARAFAGTLLGSSQTRLV